MDPGRPPGPENEDGGLSRRGQGHRPPPGFLRRLRTDAARAAAQNPSWPLIPVVTPSFDRTRFLKREILSVLNQRDPNPEDIVLDGISMDAGPEILRRREPFLVGWVSEPDSGQPEALGNGFARTTGKNPRWIEIR